MRLSRLTAVAAVLASLPLTSARARAQHPIHVARHAPTDTIRSGTAITITFDRPVAGSLERSANPERFVRLEPRFAAKVQWRDPSTLRVIPNEPLPPGRRYRITVEKGLTAMDGGRLADPYRFTLHTGAPMLLGSVPSLSPNTMAQLDPRGRVTLVYTAAVDSAALARVARFELSNLANGPRCSGASVRFRPVRQRAVVDDDGYTIRSWMYDSEVDSQFIRVVQLEPESPPPESCFGVLVLPSFDANDREEIRYRVMTASRFVVGPALCQDDECFGQPLTLAFSSPVDLASLKGHIRVDPDVPFTIIEGEAPSPTWSIRLPTKAKTTYRLMVDSAVRDVFGRRLSGARVVTYAIGDRKPALGHQLGFFTLSRQHPMLRISHVNTDSVEIAMVAIPDSARATVLSVIQQADSLVRLVSRLRDTVKLKVRLTAPVNEDRITEVSLPPALLNAGGLTPLIAVRATALGWQRTTSGPIVPAVRGAPQQLPSVNVQASVNGLTRHMAIVQVTDLVAHSRFVDDGGAVLVTNMNTGAPTPQATVVLRDRSGRAIAGGVTDASGLAHLTPDPSWSAPVRHRSTEENTWYDYDDYSTLHTSFVDVSRGADRSATPVQFMRASPWFEGYRSASDADFIRAMIYPERAIYRPGEKVYLGMIVRHGVLDRLRPLPVGDSVRVRLALTGYPPEVVRDTVVRLNQFGTAVDSFVTSRAAPLGEYQVRLDVMGQSGWRSRASTTFRVAEYRAPQFRAGLTLDSSVRYVGDSMPVRLDASYYFGAPMAKAAVRWSTSSEPQHGVRIPGLPSSFTVATMPYLGGPDQQRGGDRWGVDTLDVAGRRSLTLPTNRGSLIGPARVTVSVSVEDVDRQTVTTERSTVLHSSEFYIAARDSGTSWYWRQDTPRILQLLTVRPDGRHVADVRVTATVIRQHSQYVRRTDSPDGTWRWVSDTVSRDSVVSSDSIVRFKFTPSRDGWYTVLLSATDRAGHRVATALGGYVIPARWFGGWGLDPAGLAIKLARDTVSLGDSATLSFISPFAQAEAWLTVERERIITQRRAQVAQGENAISVRVDESFVPGATVSLLLVDASPAWKTDSLSRRIRSASATLIVGRSTKEIAVELTPLAPRYAPGDSARVRIGLRDHRGRPVRAQVALWAVDEAILALTDSTRLSVLDTMYAQRSSRLEFRSTAGTLAQLSTQLRPAGWIQIRGMASLASNMHMEQLVVTGTAAAAPEFALRKDFRSTAFYLASLVTDANGTVTAAAKLPDNLTTYRLIAVAVDSADRFGGAESSVMVTRPLIARSALPRFLRTGDAFRAGAAITNQTGGNVTAVVTARATSASLLGNPKAVLPLQDNRTSEVRYDWKTSAGPGDTVVFTFAVADARHADAVETALPVQPFYSPRYHAMSGVVRGTQAVRMLLPPDIDPVRSKLTLRVGTLPIPAITAAYDMFRWYPYQCTEQLTSSGRTILALLRLKRAGVVDSVAEPSSSILLGRLQGVVDELSRRQTEQGGIGYWSSAGWTTPPITGEVGKLLLDARELGTIVREPVVERLKAYLKGKLDDLSVDSTYGNARQRATRTSLTLGRRLSVLNYLRHAADPDVDAEDELLDLERSMVWQDRVWLAELLATRDDLTEARTLLASVWRDVEIAGNRVVVPDSLFDTYGFRSHVRPAARLLLATLAIDSTHPQLFRLIESVVQQSKATTGWEWNTQDYAAAAEAMSRIALWQRNARGGGPTLVRSSQTRTEILSVRDRQMTSTTVSLDGLTERDGEWTAVPLQIVTSGSAPTFYTLTVDEVPRTPPTTADVKGIIVERWYERFHDGRPVTEVKEGDLVRVRLRVTVPSDREFVAVADPLPAGLEVVDLSLRTSGTLGPFESNESRIAEQVGDEANRDETMLYGSWWGGWWSPWEHTEQRDDRVLYFARRLWKGSYTAQYVARATTAGTFIKPPAHAEEMYNQSLGGRSDGGVFRVLRK